MKKNIKEKPLITLTEMNIGNSVESFAKLLDFQKDLFHSQVNQLQHIVSIQCRLTGVNPLSQEMAAGALAINIGKRPRDLLNPKAVKYMQSVFSIKDTITKTETREISALCGVTVTQVREFFASQRSRVRKHARLSREKAIRVEAARASQEGCSTRADLPMHVPDPIPLNTVNSTDIKSDTGKTLEAECSISSDAGMAVINPTPLNSVGPKAVGEAPPSFSLEETVMGADEFEKKFIENIFSMMRKEETFHGQVKLMEWILKIQNSSVLYWFVTKGGLMMLVAWLNEAALEEQTTALLAVFQVLCHLPLHKALPPQMSAILQTVNRLRFYRTSDISNRAKVCLSRWSKMFLRSQALKKPSSGFGAQGVKNLCQSEILKNEWQSNLDLPDEILSLALDSTENQRITDSPSLMLLQASNDDQNEKNVRNVSAVQTKERRKVQLMEHPGRNTNGRGPQVTRAMHVNQGRPMSADDIQKAKLRATFLQNKYGKTKPASNEQHQRNIHDLDKSSISRISQSPSPSKPYIGTIKEQHLAKSSTSQISHLQSPLKPHVIHKKEVVSTKYLTYQISDLPSPMKTQVRHTVEESERPVGLSSETSPTPPDPPLDSKPSAGTEESPLEKLKRDKIPWHLPPEITMNSEWGVCFGENSKEVEIQTGRMSREKETSYQRTQDIPPNPKEPWDLEMDYDDSLTLRIPTEQASEEFPTEQVLQAFPKTQAIQEFPTEVDFPPQNVATVSVIPVTAAPSPITSSENVPEPDLELLAVLLKNPELVFALTSGQSGNLSSAETVKLLDMIKNTGGELSRLIGFKEDSTSLPSPTPHSLPSPTPTSFPSPTPSSERVMDGWRTEIGNNSFQQPGAAANGEAYVLPLSEPRNSGASSVQHYSETRNFRPQSVEFQNQASYMAQQHNEGHWVDNMESHHSSSRIQINHSSAAFNPSSQQNFQAASYRQMQPETMSYGQMPLHPQEPVHYGQMQEFVHYGQMQTHRVKPVPVSVVMNLPDGAPVTLPPSMQSQQPSHFPDNSYPQPMHPPPMQWNAASSSNMYKQMGGRQIEYEPSGSTHWSHSNQDDSNNSFPEYMQPDGASWDRDEFMDERDYDTYNTEGGVQERSRSPEFRSGRNYSEPRRDRGGRNGRQNWSRRRGSGRRDRKQENRQWRDRRY